MIFRNSTNLIALTGAALLALGACSEHSPESQLADAEQDVDSVSNRLENIEKQIAEHEARLDELRERRQQAKDRLKSAEERLEARATDVALFRSVQTALLEAPGLTETAINVLVEDGNVTLVGAVPTVAEREQALEIARSTPGVGSVKSRIRIDNVETQG